MPVISSEKKPTEKLAHLITSSADISALLSEFPAPLEAGSAGPKRKKARADEPDLSQYQSGSSSSGNSSPQHEDDDDDASFRVTDVDMWEVLEALELPAPNQGTTASANLEAGFHETPRSSPNITGTQMQGAAAPADPGDLSVFPVAGLTGPLLGFTNLPANKRPALLGAPRPATTPVKAASKAVSSKALPAAPKEMPAPPAPKSEGSDVGEDDLEAGSCNDPAEEKRLKRMRRNRESAAMSRNRKKAYIEELETKVTSLTSMVQALQSENWALKEENNALRAAKGLPSLDPADSRQLVESSSAQQSAADSSTLAAPGAGRKLGTAGLALASALTLVTLSVNTPDGMSSPVVGSRAHAPTSRVLMSLPDDLAGLADTTGMTDAAPLWPSLDLAHAEIEALEAAPEAAMLLPPEEAAAADAASLHKLSSARVTHLPLNSSWADALKSEAAAEREAAIRRRPGMQLLAHQRRGWDGKHEPPDLHIKYEGHLHDDDDEIFPDLDASSDASQRFIYCARSYAFDVLKTAKGNSKAPAPAPPPSHELSLPAAMPSRFRHAAQASAARQLTDGSNKSGRSLPDAASTELPVVNLLLPFDALGGGMAESMPPKAAADATPGSSLVQVTCQVLNASRFS
uniref:BZIP domain-containing protein n=1 Tax=Calcidiscus leptoporus TaxID=127549 RepID=A0A7S0NNZ0_9EUKA